MHKRNKFTLLLAMPIAVILWGVGWIFSLTGTKKKAEETKRHVVAKTYP